MVHRTVVMYNTPVLLLEVALTAYWRDRYVALVRLCASFQSGVGARNLCARPTRSHHFLTCLSRPRSH